MAKDTPSIWYRTSPHSHRIDAVEVLRETAHSLTISDGWKGDGGKQVRKQTAWETYWPDYTAARAHLMRELIEERDGCRVRVAQAEAALVALTATIEPPKPRARVKMPTGPLKV